MYSTNSVEFVGYISGIYEFAPSRTLEPRLRQQLGNHQVLVLLDVRRVRKTELLRRFQQEFTGQSLPMIANRRVYAQPHEIYRRLIV